MYCFFCQKQRTQPLRVASPQGLRAPLVSPTDTTTLSWWYEFATQQYASGNSMISPGQADKACVRRGWVCRLGAARTGQLLTTLAIHQTNEMHCFASETQIWYRNSDFWRWVFYVFKMSRKPTAEKSSTENPRTKRLIFVMENISCRKYGIQSTNEMVFKRTVTLRASFWFPAIACARQMPSCSF